MKKELNSSNSLLKITTLSSLKACLKNKIPSKIEIARFFLGGIIVFLIQYCSFYILKFFRIPFPSAILGIIVLFLLMEFKIIKEVWIKGFCEFILKYMILFFIPLFVGMMNYFDIILANFWAIILTIFITTTLIIVLVGVFVENVIKFIRLLRIKKISNKIESPKKQY